MNNNSSSLGDRMKSYENISRIYLTKKTPVIIRIDGRAFHNFTKGFDRPFDNILIKAMQDTGKYLCENICGCKLAYTQSDEISLLLVDYERNETDPWFQNNLQKLVSVSASMATLAFNYAFQYQVNKEFTEYVSGKKELRGTKEEFDPKFERYFDRCFTAMFDSRAFILPKEEVCNYFIWRQQDASKNSIQMVARSIYPHKELQNKNCDELQEIMFQDKQVNWNDFDAVYKRGTCIVKKQFKTNGVVRSKWIVDKEIPIFTQERNYIDELVYVGKMTSKSVAADIYKT